MRWPRWTRGRHRPTKTDLPTPPEGWALIAPIEAKPGDGVLLPDGIIRVLDSSLFDPIPLETRRRSWAIRRTHLPIETWETCRGWYEKPRWWQVR